MKIIYILLLALVSLNSPRITHADQPADQDTEIVAEDESNDGGLREILLYIPNRVFDFADIFRARVRVGPGFAIGVRATELVNLYAGSYASVYAGLPGPRLRTSIPLPAGLESHNGVSVSLADLSVDGGIGPDYSSSEFGFGFQAAIIGLDLGIDPVEIIDFFAGILCIDMKSDDF